MPWHLDGDAAGTKLWLGDLPSGWNIYIYISLRALCRFSVRLSPARPIKFELAYSIRDSDGATTPTAIVFLTEHQPVYIDGKRSGDGLW